MEPPREPFISDFGDLIYAFGVVDDIGHANPNKKLYSTYTFEPRYIDALYGLDISSREGWGQRDVLAYGLHMDSWFVVEAWCDTTGWDCQSGGSFREADSFEELVRFGMSKETRRVFGFQLEGEEE